MIEKFLQYGTYSLYDPLQLVRGGSSRILKEDRLGKIKKNQIKLGSPKRIDWGRSSMSKSNCCEEIISRQKSRKTERF